MSWWSLLNCVPSVPTCQHALLTYVLTCQRALRAYVLTCQRALRAYVLTCHRALRAYVLTCQRAMRAYVLTCFACLRAHVPTCHACFLCLRAYVFKNSFQICFPYIFVIVLSFLFLWNKALIYCCIALTMRKPLTGAMTDFVQ